MSGLPLDDRLKNSLAKMGITHLTSIQAAALGPAMSDSDVLIKSQTGSGKTLAYGIPLIQLMVQVNPLLHVQQLNRLPFKYPPPPL